MMPTTNIDPRTGLPIGSISQPTFLERIGGLLGGNQSYGGLLSPEDQKAANQQALLAAGLNLMAAGGPSTQRTSLGQALAGAASAGMQTRNQATDAALQTMLLKSQIAKANQKDRGNLVSVVGPNGKPTLKYEADAEGATPWTKEGSGIGNYQPGDYTPESWAQFVKSNDPNVLKRYVTPRQEYAPSFQNVTRTLSDGSTQQGTFDTRSGAYNWSGPIVPPGQKSRVDAQGQAEGEATGSQAAKAPAAASFDYVVNEMERQIDNTTQGGIGGVFGKIGSVTDYKDAQRFDNLREQLSTEMRTLYRIPGEGTLSDREQAQYGLQLPSRDNSPETNRAILRDLKERTRLRLQTPVAPSGDGQYQPVRKRYNPATGKIE